MQLLSCRLTKSDFQEPLNIGSDEMVSMSEMAEIVLSFDGKNLPIHHIPGPEGVRGRNSDNTLIKEKLGWSPTMRLKVRSYLYFWNPSSLCLSVLCKSCQRLFFVAYEEHIITRSRCSCQGFTTIVVIMTWVTMPLVALATHEYVGCLLQAVTNMSPCFQYLVCIDSSLDQWVWKRTCVAPLLTGLLPSIT